MGYGFLCDWEDGEVFFFFFPTFNFDQPRDLMIGVAKSTNQTRFGVDPLGLDPKLRWSILDPK